MDPRVTKSEREEEVRPGNEAVRRETWPGASDQVIETINRVLGEVAERFDGLSLTNTKTYFTAHLSGEGARTRTDWCFHPKGQFFLTEIRQPRSPEWDNRLNDIQGLDVLEYNKSSGGQYRLKVFPTCGQDAISAIVDLASETLSRKAHLIPKGKEEASKATASVFEESGGVPQDDAEAVNCYRRAADQGDADAQFKLGVMYSEGRGVPQDDAEAVNWYRLAAEQGLSLIHI